MLRALALAAATLAALWLLLTRRSQGEADVYQSYDSSFDGYVPLPTSEVSDATVWDTLDKYAAYYGVDSSLVHAMAKQESGGDQGARSSKGAIGVMQLMPSTAADLGVDPYDEEQNIKGGVSYIASLLKKYGGDKRKALAAYNWGQGHVDREGMSNLPSETRNYLSTILGG